MRDKEATQARAFLPVNETGSAVTDFERSQVFGRDPEARLLFTWWFADSGSQRSVYFMQLLTVMTTW